MSGLPGGSAPGSEKPQPFRDGTQTPVSPARADALDFALHAIAACCRTCASYWHGLPKGRALTDSEIAYLSELARRYLDARLPDLAEEGQRVRSRGSSASRDDSNVRPLASAPVQPPKPPGRQVS